MCSLFGPVFSAILESHQKRGDPIDMDSNGAFIALIPKPHKNHSDVANYHPISWINTDILANRLLSFLASYIHSDQVGFLPHRQAAGQLNFPYYTPLGMAEEIEPGCCCPLRFVKLSIPSHGCFFSGYCQDGTSVLSYWPRCTHYIAHPQLLSGHKSDPIPISCWTLDKDVHYLPYCSS